MVSVVGRPVPGTVMAMLATASAAAQLVLGGTAHATAGDTTPPVVVDRSPTQGARGVPTGSNIVATLSEPLDASTVDAASVYLQRNSVRVPAEVALSEDGTRVVLRPVNRLIEGADYAATVVGGPEGSVTDLAGNPLKQSARWTFTVNNPPRVRPIAPAADSTTRDRTPKIAFRAVDDETPLKKRAVRVKVDGSRLPFSYDDGAGSLSPRLSRGEHTVSVRARDGAAAVTRRAWSFTIR